MKNSMLGMGVFHLVHCRRRALIVIFASAVGCLVLQRSSAQTNSFSSCFNYTNFISTNGLVLTGTSTQTGDIVRLTPASSGQEGNLWRADQQACGNGFDTHFQFQISNPGAFPGTPSGGDGIGFAIQSDGPADTEFFGLSSGSNYTAVFFNTFYNWPGCGDYQHCDVSDNSVGVMANGVYVAQTDLNSLGINLKDGSVHSTRIFFDGSALTVWLDNQTVLMNVPAPGLKPGTDNSGLGWVGFSSITGWAWEDHDILNWSFCSAQSSPVAPYIISQPADQTVTVGGTVHFAVVSGGSSPLSYQWSFKGINIDGATSSALTITNVQRSQAGPYAVAVSNAVGSTNSSNASLTVNLPPATIHLVDASTMAGTAVTTPIILLANGNENAVGFSLYYNTSLLSFVDVQLGGGASGATLLINTNQTGSGRVGIALALPTDSVFNAGTQELVEVTFTSTIGTNTVSTQVTFGDSPIGGQLSDPPGNTLPANFTGGTITLAPTEFEADVAPRPGGNQAVTIADWVVIGRFAARVDYPSNSTEFQRADCAPRSMLGNGEITVSDWVQAGRYAAGLDPLTPVGGPTSDGGALALAQPINPRGSNPRPATTREVLIGNASFADQTGSVPIQLQSLGNENALGFSLIFNPSQFRYQGVALGSAATSAAMNVNTNQAALGQVAFVLALPTGSTFAGGVNELLKVSLQPLVTAPTNAAVSFADQPVPREVSAADATVLDAAYVNGVVTVNPRPSVRISRNGPTVTLAWPQWATGFNLQDSSGGFPAGAWSNLSLTPTVTNGQNQVAVPMATGIRFYRLYHP